MNSRELADLLLEMNGHQKDYKLLRYDPRRNGRASGTWFSGWVAGTRLYHLATTDIDALDLDNGERVDTEGDLWVMYDNAEPTAIVSVKRAGDTKKTSPWSVHAIERLAERAGLRLITVEKTGSDEYEVEGYK